MVLRQYNLQINHINTRSAKSKTIHTGIDSLSNVIIIWAWLLHQMCQLLGWHSWWKSQVISCIKMDSLLLFMVLGGMLDLYLQKNGCWQKLNIMVNINLIKTSCFYNKSWWNPCLRCQDQFKVKTWQLFWNFERAITKE